MSRSSQRRLLLGVLVIAVLGGLASPVEAFEGEPIVFPPPPVNVTGVQIHGVGLDDQGPITAAVSDVVGHYLDGAVITGLQTGQPADVSAAFTGAARTRLSSDDRSILVEEDARRPAVLRVSRNDAELVVLTGPSRNPEVVVARINHAAVGFGGDTGRLDVVRTGELVLVFQDDAWRIDSYDLQVNRERDPLPPLSLLWPFSEEV